VANPPDELNISIASDNKTSEAKIERKAFEKYFVFYRKDLSTVQNYTYYPELFS